MSQKGAHKLPSGASRGRVRTWRRPTEVAAKGKKPPEGGPLRGTWKQFYQPLVTQRTSSRNEPMPLVNIELHGTVVTHLQQERLAVVLIFYVHALHDVERLQRLFAKGN